MNKTKQILTTALAVVVLTGGGFWLYNNQNNQVEVSNNTTTQQVAKEQPKLTVAEDKKTVSYEGQEGQTALAILKTLTDVKTEESSFGEFVVGINGVEADSSKEYWSFYVNDAYGSEGAGTYQTKTGEQIKWVLEKL